MKNFKNNDWWEKIAIYIVIFGLVALAIYSLKIFYKGYSLFTDWNNLDIEATGLFGDFFGGVIGSLWTLAGVFLYFSALKVQQKQLDIQMRDMKQNENLISQQQFETTFFGLLQTQRDLKKEMSVTFWEVAKNNGTYKIQKTVLASGNIFPRIIQDLKSLYSLYKSNTYNIWNEDEVNFFISQFHAQVENSQDDPSYDYAKEYNKVIANLNDSFLTWFYGLKKETITKAQSYENDDMICRCIYGHIYIKYHEQLGYYFRHLYNITKFLNTEKITCINNLSKPNPEELIKIEKRFNNYFSFIYSILSDSELALLFYNSLLFPKSKKLYIDYGMFNNLLSNKLIKKEHANLIDNANLKDSNELFHSIITELNKTNS